MKVLHLISNLDRSGGTRAALTLHQSLLAAGMDSRLVSCNGARGYQTFGSYRFSGGWKGHLQQAIINLEKKLSIPSLLNVTDFWWLPPEIKGFEGIVHVHVTHVAQIGWPLIRGLAKRNPVVWTLHDLWPLTGKCIHPLDCDGWLTQCGRCPKLQEYPRLYTDRTNLLQRIKHNFIKQNDVHFVAPSQWLKSEAVSVLRALDAEISIIPHAIDGKIFHPIETKLIRSKWGLEKIKGTIVLFPQGRWDDPKKGTTLFDELIRMLLQQTYLRAPVNIVVLGGSSVAIEQLNEEICKITLPFANTDEAINEYYNLADVCVSLSEVETFGLSVAESLCAGTPVLAARAKGIDELLADAPFGGLLPRDSKAIIHAINTFERLDHLQRQELSVWAVGKFSVANLVKQHKRLYESVDGIFLTSRVGPASDPTSANRQR